MASYDYQVGGAFLSNGVSASKLHAEIAASALTGVFSYIVVEGSFCSVFTSTELTAQQKATLDSVVSAHDAAPVAELRFFGSSTVVNGEVDITDASWVALGGVVTTPEFFAPVASLKARITGSFKAAGSGAQLRLMEDGQTVLGSFDLTETSGQWETMQWFNEVSASEGTHEYTLEARLGAATSAQVRYVSMSLLEVVV